MTTSEHYPQEYLDGKVEFFYLDFFVNEHVLIPRFETESLVRKVLQDMKNAPVDYVIDIGTGSGIIPVCLGKNTKLEHITAIDISPEALNIAKKNADHHGVHIDFQLSNLFSYFLENPSLLSQKNIIVTANLPYIKNDDWEHMSDDTRHEPKLALFGGKTTGFEMYEILFEQLHEFTSLSSVRSLTFYMEMGYDQSELALAECKKYHWSCELFADPANIPRFAKIRIL